MSYEHYADSLMRRSSGNAIPYISSKMPSMLELLRHMSNNSEKHINSSYEEYCNARLLVQFYITYFLVAFCLVHYCN